MNTSKSVIHLFLTLNFVLFTQLIKCQEGYKPKKLYFYQNKISYNFGNSELKLIKENIIVDSPVYQHYIDTLTRVSYEFYIIDNNVKSIIKNSEHQVILEGSFLISDSKTCCEDIQYRDENDETAWLLVKNNKWKEYSSDGYSLGNYVDNKKNGLWYSYKNGKLTSKVRYDNGLITEKFNYSTDADFMPQ